MWNINELFWTLLDSWKLLLASAELKDLRITLEFYQNCAQHWLWKEAHKLYVLYLAYNIFYTMLVMKFKNGIHYTGACTVCTVWAALFLCVVIWIVQTPRHRGEVIDCSPLHSQPRDTRGTTWHTHSWDLQALFNAGSLIFQRTLFYGRNVHIPILSVDFQVQSGCPQNIPVRIFLPRRERYKA